MLSEPGAQLAPGDLKDEQKPPLPAAKRTPPSPMCVPRSRQKCRLISSLKSFPVRATTEAAFRMLWLVLPQFPFLPLSSQDSSKTNFSAAARCLLLRNLRAGDMI